MFFGCCTETGYGCPEVTELDPHSTYTDPEETKEMTEPLEGNFDGIGIQFNVLTDTVYVIQVIPGGPSEKVGLVAGDRIVQVNDTVIAGVKMKTTDIMKRLRGPKGSEVRVKVKRSGEPELLDFTIVRGKIPVHSIDAVYMADKSIGYIKLNRFAASSTQEFKEALKTLDKKGMKKLILANPEIWLFWWMNHLPVPVKSFQERYRIGIGV